MLDHEVLMATGLGPRCDLGADYEDETCRYDIRVILTAGHRGVPRAELRDALMWLWDLRDTAALAAPYN
jgi:hypothetical protein